MKRIVHNTINISNLWSNINYLSNIPYYIGYIIEYDISKANINALKYMGKIDTYTYNMLYNSPKKYREIYIGKMIQKDHEIYNYIQKGIIDAKKEFFILNHIQDNEVLSIKNDAIIVLSDRYMHTHTLNDNMIFIQKEYYTFYFISKRKEFYYRYDNKNNIDIIEIKGMSDKMIEYHRDYMLAFILDIFYKIQLSNIEDVLMSINVFYEAYITRKLNYHFYRDFSSNSIYRITMKNGKSYGLSDLNNPNNDIQYIDIRYNLGLLRDLSNMINSIYFNHIR